MILKNLKFLAIPFLLGASLRTTSQTFSKLSIPFDEVSSGTTTWVDYDGDGDLDLLISGKAGYQYYVTTMYRNEGNDNFTKTNISFPGISELAASFSDLDNDGDQDVVFCSKSDFDFGIFITKIYLNQEGINFIEDSSQLVGVNSGRVACGDYNNDGYPDIILSGLSNNGPITVIYKNNQHGGFDRQSHIFLPGGMSSVSWVDYNKDGYLDLFLTGNTEAGPFTRLYKNIDGAFFEDSGIAFTQTSESTGSWSDFDNDGDNDLLLSGNNEGTKSNIYVNDSFSFHKSEISLKGVISGCGLWGDFDHDGDQDILLSGLNGLGQYDLIIYKNTNNGFEELNDTSLAVLSGGGYAWADYDNDGDLDLAAAGSAYYGGIYRNESDLIQQTLEPPQNLSSDTAGASVILKWSPIDSGVFRHATYNVMVKKTVDSAFLVAPQSMSDGFRLIPESGNTQCDTFMRLSHLKKGIYQWNVQAVDYSYHGGPFSAISSFTITSSEQASNVLITQSKDGSLVRWQRGNLDHCIVFMKEDSSGFSSPLDNITYMPSDTFGKGTQIDTTGWYCIYKGEADSCVVNNIKSNINYIIHVLEYNGDPGYEEYLKENSINNPAFFKGYIFQENNSTIVSENFHNADWSDIDMDGDLDILAYENNAYLLDTSRIFQNNNGLFSNLGTGYMSVWAAADGWGDHDNDGDIDLLLSGETYEGYRSKLYNNNGSGIFTETGIFFRGKQGGSASWGDYDNDGDLDLLLTGLYITNLYKNNGNSNFSESGIYITGVYDSSTDWGDYNNDGCLDILLSGLNNNSKPTTELYKNNCNGTFTLQSGLKLDPVSKSHSCWEDINGDGYLDILLTGANNSELVTKIFFNNGNGTFRDADFLFEGVHKGSLSAGDFNNDGKPDLLLMGSNYSQSITRIYINDGRGGFTDSQIRINGIIGHSKIGDVDSDGDLDILLSGYNNHGQGVIKIYYNSTNVRDSVPQAPLHLRAHSTNGKVTFKWDKAVDDKTSENGLSYNMFVREEGQNKFIHSPQSQMVENDSKSNNLLFDKAEIQWDSSGYFLNLPEGKTYFWSVQAIDAKKSDGKWAKEMEIKLPDRAGNIVGPQIACQGQLNVDYHIILPKNASATAWILSSGEIIYADSGKISLNFDYVKLSESLYTYGINESATGSPSPVLSVKINPSYNISENVIMCMGESYKGHTTNGTYIENLKTTLGCDSILTLNLSFSNMDTCFTDLSVINKQSLTLYPNPTNEFFTITNNDSDYSHEIFLLNSKGEILNQDIIFNNSNSITINMAGYPTGAYLLKIKTKSGKSYVYKVFKY